MKHKLISIFFSFIVVIYVFTTIGVSVISHYCGGELEQVSVFSKPDSCCGGDEEDMEEGCCKNETTHVSFQKDFTYFQLIKDCKAPVLQFLIFEFQSSFFNNRIINTGLSALKKDFPPPNLVQQDIVSISVLRI